MSNHLNGSNGSRNRDLELLIDQITDAIVARLNGDGGDQAAMCGCTSECFQPLPRAHASYCRRRRGAHWPGAGRDSSAKDWASLIDHTLLKPEATDEDIKKLCEEAAQISVCFSLRKSNLGARLRL